MKQILLDESTWDWKFTEGRLTFVTGGERVAQRIKQALQTFFNEYFLDNQIGVPYFEYFFVKNPNLVRISAELRTAILRDEEVEQIINLELDLETATRKMSVSFSCVTNEGETVNDVLEVIV